MAVSAPTTVITSSANGAYSITGDNLQTRKTPAVTIVAACIRADTGVGPSMASGSQVCNPSWADLPIAPINNKIAATSNAGNSKPKNTIEVLEKSDALEKMSSNSILPNK